MDETSAWNVVKEALEAPCAHCGDSDSDNGFSYLTSVQHWGMPVKKPQYVDPYIEGLAGPNEQHVADPGSHCENPKCSAHFSPEQEAEIAQGGGSFTCPECGWEQNVSAEPTYLHNDPEAWYDLAQSGNLDTSTQRPANPGGRTNAGLTLKQMGDIGEALVLRMGELPGIGVILPAHQGDYNFPIDCIVESQNGKFGCEIKSNHSTAQQRFKVGGKAERLEKIKFCVENGLKPALIGVRLNFFTDKAFIFFREGLTDTWVGNQKMIHVATVDFADLNPFKSPDPQAQALAVENADLPDQSEEDEFDQIFGKPSPQPQQVTASKFFTVPYDVHDLKVVDRDGKHTHNIRRCHHCGVVYQRPSDHAGFFGCPTCGSDVDSEPRLAARVILAGPSKVDALAKQYGWRFLRRTGKNERIYGWTDPQGFVHDCSTGSGAHRGSEDIDAMYMRQRMQRCMSDPWNCYHAKMKGLPPENRSVEAGLKHPVLHQGQMIEHDDNEYLIQEIEHFSGMPTLVAVIDMKTGKPGTFTLDELQKSAAKDPDYLFVYYMSELRVEEWENNLRFEGLLDRLLEEFGQTYKDISNPGNELDPTDVAAGEIFEYDDEIRIEHKQLSKPEVRDEAERLINKWYDDKKSVFDSWGEPYGPGPERDPDTGQWVAA